MGGVRRPGMDRGVTLFEVGDGSGEQCHEVDLG